MIVLTLGGIGILLIFFIYYKYHQIKTYWAKKGVPHVKPMPILGNMKLSRSEDFLEDIYNAHPNKRYVGFHHFHQPTLLIRDPELIKTIVVKEFPSFSEHSLFNRGIGERYKSFFSLSVEEGWKDVRNILTPIFTNSKLRSMFKLVHECADVFVNHFKDQSVEVDLKDAFSKYANDAIVTTIFGVGCDSFADKNNTLYVTGKKLVDYSGLKGLSYFAYNISPFLTKVLNVKPVTNEVGQIFEDLIVQVVKDRKERGIIRPDVLQLMIEAKNKSSSDTGRRFTNEDIVASAITLYFGSFDTTSTMSTITAYALAVYPDVQKKVREVVDETMARCKEQLTFEDVMNMEYLEMVISETLRKWPVAFLDRLCVKPFVIEPVNDDEKPVTIDPGTSIWLSLSGLHHDSKYFEDPDKFDPERFNPKNKKKPIPYTYLPFGAGPRICIGTKYVMFVMKLIFTKILYNFELVPCEKTPKSLTTGLGFFVPPKGGLRINFKPRRK